MVEKEQVLHRIKGGLIVSCQAHGDNPLKGSIHMAAMAKAAEMAGAVGIRANGGEDVAAIRACVQFPIIGINKLPHDDHPVVITPTFESAQEVVDAGAAIVATSFKRSHRSDQRAMRTLVRRIQTELGALVMADCTNYEEGLWAMELGADIVATTYSHARGYSPDPYLPDLELLGQLVQALPGVPVIGEGRFWHPDDVAAGLKLGAHAIVVGTAITNPVEIVARFVAAIEKGPVLG